MTLLMTYKERLQADYERIRADTKAGKLPLPERLQQIAEATDRYALAHAEDYEAAVDKAIAAGRSPGLVPIPFKDDRLLHNMADLCMDEYLRWSHPDKMSIVEYPVMSDSQAKLRKMREWDLREVKVGKDDVTTGKYRDHFGVKRRIYDFMAPKKI